MGRANDRPQRCAIYARKSSEEGLEQDFNSLDAQREACEAYIKSQAGEGWRPVRAHYDDGGFSGGTLDRPALQRLLEDIKAGKIDTVVVYKVDRLTRSLADFAKIVEVLDAHEVSFVSVTQQFNTTTSMGRLTLNMLLSFAQFEREVTGERIRDKIAASKRKGLWMGGYVPLGYAAAGRTLSVVESEAKTVRTLFQRYIELGSVALLKEDADQAGLKSKVREAAEGRMRGGRPFTRGHLYKILSNPLYAGRIAHKGDSFEGQHPAIIDEETWTAVRRRLASQALPRSREKASVSRSALRGKIFDEFGMVLTPSHTTKSGRRYRYYVSREVDSSGPQSSSRPGPEKTRWRLPAQEIERRVGDAVKGFLADQAAISAAGRSAGVAVDQLPGLLSAASAWNGAPLALVQRVDLRPDGIELAIDGSKLEAGHDVTLRHALPLRLRRRGVETRLVLAGGAERRPDGVDPSLVKAIIRGRDWFERLVDGRARSYAEIAHAEGVNPRYVAHLVPLAFLAPDIVASVVAGTQPADLTTEVLTKRMDLPLAWDEQRAVLGFTDKAFREAAAEYRPRRAAGGAAGG